jgi:hypothetical protein
MGVEQQDKDSVACFIDGVDAATNAVDKTCTRAEYRATVLFDITAVNTFMAAVSP